MRAEQNVPGNLLGIGPRTRMKEVAMVQHVSSWGRRLIPTALVVSEWCAFVVGVAIPTLWPKIALLSVARVLPSAFTSAT